jgi:hypothetical protein
MIGLDDAGLLELTGYRRRTMQRKILDRNGIPYFVAASGRPVVLKENLVERKVSGPDGPKTQPRLRLAASAASPRR